MDDENTWRIHYQQLAKLVFQKLGLEYQAGLTPGHIEWLILQHNQTGDPLADSVPMLTQADLLAQSAAEFSRKEKYLQRKIQDLRQKIDKLQRHLDKAQERSKTYRAKREEAHAHERKKLRSEIRALEQKVWILQEQY